MICKKCSKEFPTRIYIDNKLRNLGSRKFCLECSPFGKHNTSQLHKTENEYTCFKCKKTLSKNKFYKRSGRKKNHSSYCKICSRIINMQRLHNNKKRAIEYKGGMCQKCGYKKYIGALEFHHLDPKQKDIRFKNLTLYSWNTIKKEIDKCILLCSNCHREIHGNI